jgi:hypothetical protein
MPVLCDFQVIQGDVSKRIGDGATLWEKSFSTSGRESSGHAILMFMVRGLTSTHQTVKVKINNKEVGEISNYHGANSQHWFTQIINVGGNNLRHSGNNELQLEAVSYPEASAANLFDDFEIRDVVCFFQQKA